MPMSDIDFFRTRVKSLKTTRCFGNGFRNCDPNDPLNRHLGATILATRLHSDTDHVVLYTFLQQGEEF